MKFNSFLLILSTLFIVAILGLSSNNLVNGEDAYFAFRTHHDEDFVFKISKDDIIQQARMILNGTEVNRIHVMGRIVKRQKDYNPRYDFYLDPDTIQFFEVAIEVCDASTEYVNDHLDEACGAFLPGCYWCPWASKLSKEIKPSFDLFDPEKEFGIHLAAQH